ncbi:MAG: hypothetical protein V4685_03855 [Bacteroidota bacterium]
MRNFLLVLLFGFALTPAFSQVTYIGITNHNTGSGSNNLFNNYVATGQQCYIDWEVYSDGMTNMEACGFRSDSRLILRREGDNDTTSVVASAPVIVPGICAGKNGNNDHYYVELSSYIDKPGRYSVEIQADLPNMTYPFENATTKTTWNYLCPSAYYLTGTSGPTGNYYTPSGSCTGGPGLSDPVGGQGTDMLAEIFSSLKYFTVGEVGTYREMVVMNDNFYDLPKGKFQPGNPTLPVSLNGTNGIPSYGICPVVAAPQINIGGEINNFKRTDCSADVTGAALFYRLYKDGTPVPVVFQSFNLDFKDDCPSSANGPEGNIFPTGGSCQNANNILDQRWQTMNGVNNILPASFALNDTGLWKIELFTETYMKDCTGTAFTRNGDTSTTSFTVNNPELPGSPCANVIPVILSSFTVTASANNNILNWKVEEATQVKNFEIQRSFDGYGFHSIGIMPYSNGKSSFIYSDAAYPGTTVFYRIIIHELSGYSLYSFIVKANGKNNGIKLVVQPAAQSIMVKLENFNKGKYDLGIINNAGSLVSQKRIVIPANGNANVAVALKTELAHAVYYAVIRDEQGSIIAKSSFYY